MAQKIKKGHIVKLSIVWVIVALLAAGVTVAAAPEETRAQYGLVPAVERFSYSSWESEVHLTDNAGDPEVAVTETIVAQFPDDDQNKGIVRWIPGHVVDDDAFLEVTDDNGDAVPFRAVFNLDEGMTIVEIGTDDYVHGEQTYVIEYETSHQPYVDDDSAVEHFAWNMLPEESLQSIGEFTGSLHISPELSESLTGDFSCFQGPYGSTDKCEADSSTSDDGSIIFETSSGQRDPGDSLTLAVDFEQGTFNESTSAETAEPDTTFRQSIDYVFDWPVAMGTALLAIFIALAAMMHRSRALASINSPPQTSHRTIRHAPSNLPPVIGFLLWATSPRSTRSFGDSLTAQVVNLAALGAIKLEPTPGKSGEKDGVRARLVDPQRAVHKLDKLTVKALFPGNAAIGDVRDLVTDSTTISRPLAGVFTASQKIFKEEGFAQDANTKKSFASLVAVVSLLIGIASTVVTYSWYNATGDEGVVGIAFVLAVIALILSGVAVSEIFNTSQTLTVAGWKALQELDGLRTHINDRIKQSRHASGHGDVENSEQLLPWAVLFGVNKEWEEILETDYQSSGAHSTMFTSETPSSSVNVAHVLQVVTRSSTYAPPSSASGGGGTSGGFTGGSTGGGSFSGGGGGGGRVGGR